MSLPAPPTTMSEASLAPARTVSLPPAALISFAPGLPKIVSPPSLPTAFSKLSASSVPIATPSPRRIVTPPLASRA